MAFMGRGSIPSNYEDFINSVTAAMTLPTPTAQYLFAQWAIAGRLNFQALNAGMTTVQQYISAAGGGAPIPPDMDRLIRVADSYPNFVMGIDEFGPNMGDTIKFQRQVYSNGGLTEAARELTTNAAISTTGISVQTEEVPVVLKQYHGPYAATGSGVAPLAIANFDSKYRANKLQLTSMANRHLLHDYTIWLDRVIRDRFLAADTITLPDGISAVTGFVAGGGETITGEQMLNARKTLTDREWQPFDNGRYVALVPTSFNTQMWDDPQYQRASENHAAGRNQIFGYIGSLQDMDIFECSTLASYAAGSTVSGTGGGTVPTGVTLNEGIIVGPGAVGFGTAAPDPEGVLGPVARFADDTNYGTMVKVIWYALHAFQTLDQRGVERFIYQTV